MRLALLGFIFLLILTLGNAWLLHRGQQVAAAASYAPSLQLNQPVKTHQEWDGFVWRELGAIVLTVLVFGTIASTVRAPRPKTGNTSRLL